MEGDSYMVASDREGEKATRCVRCEGHAVCRFPWRKHGWKSLPKDNFGLVGRPSTAESPIEAEPLQYCPPHAPRAPTPGRRQHSFVYGSWAQFWNPNRFPNWVPQTGPETEPKKCPPTVGGHFGGCLFAPENGTPNRNRNRARGTRDLPEPSGPPSTRHTHPPWTQGREEGNPEPIRTMLPASLALAGDATRIPAHSLHQ